MATRSTGRAALRRGITWLLPAIVACSQIVPDEVDPVHCSAEGAVGPPSCPVEQICQGGVCSPCGATGCGTGGGDGIGESCGAGDVCPGSLFCVDSVSLGFSGPRFCTRGCCTSQDCGEGNAVCLPSQGGALVCVPGEVAGRFAGSAEQGVACTANAECRSGLCDQNRCSDVCCSNADCAGSDRCVVLEIPDIPDHRSFMCGPVGGPGAIQSGCDSAAQCELRACVKADPFPGYCTSSCCKKSDCPGSMECVYVGGGSSAGGFRVCALTGVSGGTLPNGSPCTDNNQCESGQCVDVDGQAQFCSDACCTDKDCGDPTQFACRPLLQNGVALLLCVPR